MSSKVVLNLKTKENFKIIVKRCQLDYGCESWHSLWHCGYIHIPVQNAKFINSDVLYVHGGVTYQEQDQKYYIIGFDCSHYRDMVRFTKQPRSVGYCKNELIHLSKQIKKQIISGRRKMIKKKTQSMRGV